MVNTAKSAELVERQQRTRRARNPQSKLITLQDAESYSGIPYSTIREQVLAGHLDRVELPGSKRIWIKREQLEQMIAGGSR